MYSKVDLLHVSVASVERGRNPLDIHDGPDNPLGTSVIADVYGVLLPRQSAALCGEHKGWVSQVTLLNL